MRIARPAVRPALVFCLALVAGGCAVLPRKQAGLVPTETRYNVLYITSESMNTKHLSVYGYDKPTSPNLEAFAKSGTLFERNNTASCWTSENMNSYLTGTYSLVHGVNTRNRSTPPEWYTPLEMLRDDGYQIPKLSGYLADNNYANLGFSPVVQPIPPEEWIRKNKDKPFFIWHHILNPHLPYDPPPWAKRKFFKEEMIPNEASRARLSVPFINGVVLKGKAEFKPEEDGPALRAIYDAELLKMDQEFGRILKTVEELGLRDKTIIIFSADHGEELLEHGFVGHASTSKDANLHDEILHIPLIISLPGKVPQALSIRQQVRGIDLMPTVFELLGLPIPAYFQGASLLPLMRDPAGQPDRTAFIATTKAGYKEDDPDHIRTYRRAIRTPEWKLIKEINDGVENFRLFDLKSDPAEKVDVKEQHPRELADLTRRLGEWEATCAGWKARHFEANRYLEPEARRSWLGKRWERWFPPAPLDLTGVENPPAFTYPEDNVVWTAASTQGHVEIRWNGKKGIPYLVEVALGEGDYHFTNQVRTKEPRLIREFDQGYWNEYITQYNPAKVRVKIDRPQYEWSEWRTIQLK